MDKSNFVHFVNSVRCNHFTNIARFNEDIDRTVRGVCDTRPEWPKCNLCRLRILAASLPDWWLLRIKDVIGKISQTVRAGIF